MAQKTEFGSIYQYVIIDDKIIDRHKNRACQLIFKEDIQNGTQKKEV
jgi:predicted nucleic acid-binding protein